MASALGFHICCSMGSRCASMSKAARDVALYAPQITLAVACTKELVFHELYVGLCAPHLMRSRIQFLCNHHLKIMYNNTIYQFLGL